MRGYTSTRSLGIESGNTQGAIDALELPGGRKVGDLQAGELARFLIAAGVPGVSHTAGKLLNVEAYKQHLADLAAVAGQKAIAAWLEEKR